MARRALAEPDHGRGRRAQGAAAPHWPTGGRFRAGPPDGVGFGLTTCEAVHKTVRTHFVTQQAPPPLPPDTASPTPDLIVVGAGPAGSSTAFYLATAGLDVLVLEKSHFPREKVCGDGLTPRAVKALTAMGVPIAESDGWLPNKGLRIIGGGGRIELPWPELSSYPGFGLVRSPLHFSRSRGPHAPTRGATLPKG